MSCSRATLRLAVGGVLLLTAVAFAQAPPAKKPTTPEQSCKAYVQKFYDWYVPELFREKNTWASETALSRKEFSFSSELRKALKADFAASAAVSGEIVGLDFDPFTNSQDPFHKYVVARAAVIGPRCVTDIYGVEKGRMSKTLDLQAELSRESGAWEFVNFHYPPSGTVKKSDLLTILKLLATDRKRTP